MKPPVWLERADCLAIHEMLLSQHGGRAGVRDGGLLESALGRPKNRLAYGAPVRAGLAASYAAGIILNHPFIDGNKRTGFIVGDDALCVQIGDPVQVCFEQRGESAKVPQFRRAPGSGAKGSSGGEQK